MTNDAARPSIDHLNFRVQYELEVLLSDGVIAVSDLSPDFLMRLCTTEEAHKVLQRLRIGGGRVADPCADFDRWSGEHLAHRDSNCSLVEVLRACITPTRTLAQPTSWETSNRTLRNVLSITGSTDRMLRICFAADDEELASVAHRRLAPHVEDRIVRILRDGLTLCGRRYEFLGYSSGQLKDGGCWFYSPCELLTADGLRSMMGDFTAIRSPPKIAARMGQCFSTTIHTLMLEEKGSDAGGSADDVHLWGELPDVVRNGHTFSDGVATGSPALFETLAHRLGLQLVPSAVHIRLAGAKGMISRDERLAGMLPKLHTRPSMIKFDSPSRECEICAVATWQPGRLNRQIITLLSTLGVPEHHFQSLQADDRRAIDEASRSRERACELLHLATADGAAIVRAVLESGLCERPSDEPFVHAILSELQDFKCEELRNKSKLRVERSCRLRGVMDETGTLQYGEIFVQRSGSQDGRVGFDRAWVGSSRTVLASPVCVIKDPALHPGDVLRLRAVDATTSARAQADPRIRDYFRSLSDVLVFPQNGPRPHANETSGGDLDGDEFFVCWDERLLPPRSVPPAAYEPAGPSMQPEVFHPGYLETADGRLPLVDCAALQQWFIAFLKGDTLGRLSKAHEAWADYSPLGAEAPQCLELARLCSLAVDFPKSGRAVAFPPELQPPMRPDFQGPVHGQASYPSRKVLGTLYRACGGIEAPRPSSAPGGHHVAPRLLCDGHAEHLDCAMALRSAYSVQLQQLLDVYGLASEGELLSGRRQRTWSPRGVAGRAPTSRPFELHTLIADQVQRFAVESRAAFQAAVNAEWEIQRAAGHSPPRQLIAMRVASACYWAAYSWEANNVLGHLSFPWLSCHRELLQVLEGAGAVVDLTADEPASSSSSADQMPLPPPAAPAAHSAPLVPPPPAADTTAREVRAMAAERRLRASMHGNVQLPLAADSDPMDIAPAEELMAASGLEAAAAAAADPVSSDASQMQADEELARSLQLAEELEAKEQRGQLTLQSRLDASQMERPSQRLRYDLGEPSHQGVLSPAAVRPAGMHAAGAASAAASSSSVQQPQLVVIDAMNVGRDANFRDPRAGIDIARDPSGRSRKPVFARAIATAIEYYVTRGFKVRAFMPEWCLSGGRDGNMHAVEYELLYPYRDQRVLVLTPARMDDDAWIIDEAQRVEGSLILTNDHMQQHVDRGTITAAWRDRHIVKFCFVENELRPMIYARK